MAGLLAPDKVVHLLSLPLLQQCIITFSLQLGQLEAKCALFLFLSLQ